MSITRKDAEQAQDPVDDAPYAIFFREPSPERLAQMREERESERWLERALAFEEGESEALRRCVAKLSDTLGIALVAAHRGELEQCSSSTLGQELDWLVYTVASAQQRPPAVVEPLGPDEATSSSPKRPSR